MIDGNASARRLPFCQHFLEILLFRNCKDLINIGHLREPADVTTAGLGKLGLWPEILADLDSLTETEAEAEQDNKRFMLRSAPRPATSLALRIGGVALPPTVRQVAET
jgi:hypothetical protein